MRIYLGFDDTDTVDADRGTGKLARWFKDQIPDSCQMSGVLRQQLLVHESIPYTSHNSAACVVIDAPEACFLKIIIDSAAQHVTQYYLEGSDPGICVAFEGDSALSGLINFGRECTRKVLTQKDALDVARQFHLSGHGGTNDGIIGAAAAVGLTASGWCGRFIELGQLRKMPDIISVKDLESLGVKVVSLDRDASRNHNAAGVSNKKQACLP
jgi:tRNA(Ile2) C34 agmatinyltransferase TiaS